SSIFGAQAVRTRPAAPVVATAPTPALPIPAAISSPTAPPVPRTQPLIPQSTQTSPTAPPVKPAAGSNGASNSDMQKLRVEVARLEGLVRKLQLELAAEREYTRSLEEHMKTLQDA